MQSNRKDIRLLAANVERDAPFAHEWFRHPEGQATLISMGNAESEIETSTLTAQKAIIQEFIDLEEADKQITRMIIVGNKTIGVVWIEMVEKHGIKPPSLHVMIGDPKYRGMGIGKSVMQAAIEYIKNDLNRNTINTRHLVNNLPISRLNETLGFIKDGEPYTDANGLVWQNIKLRF